MTTNKGLAWLSAALLAALTMSTPAARAGEVVDYVEAKHATNPAPTVALDTYAHFEAESIAMDAPYAGQDANENAKARLQANLDEQLQPLLAQWNASSKGASGKTLKIEPTIRHIKFITGGKRFWGGALAGGSAVLMTVKLVDAGSGRVVAEPEFYQHANKMGAAWSFGATDKAMLVRITELVGQYMKTNYAQAVGGPTGKTDAAQAESK